MIINLITLATVKTQLGISNSDDDAAITAMIPVVSSDVRRILNNPFNKYVLAAFTSANATIDFGVGVTQRFTSDYWRFVKSFDLGQVVYHPDIAEDTYLTSYNPSNGLYTMTNTPSDTGDYVYPTVHISQWPTISKMIWYKITGQSKSAAFERGVQSEKIGPISKTYSNAEINSQYNYPQVLIDDLGTPYAEVV